MTLRYVPIHGNLFLVNTYKADLSGRNDINDCGIRHIGCPPVARQGRTQEKAFKSLPHQTLLSGVASVKAEGHVLTECGCVVSVKAEGHVLTECGCVASVKAEGHVLTECGCVASTC